MFPDELNTAPDENPVTNNFEKKTKTSQHSAEFTTESQSYVLFSNVLLGTTKRKFHFRFPLGHLS